jgi:TolB-like protein/Tfp pilus assembly protein PilF
LSLAFSHFTLDSNRRELRGPEGAIHVEPQVFDLLVYLAQNANRVISKCELIEHVWKGRIVSDAALNSRINSARRAIGESGENQKFIRTIQRHGFLFAADVITQTHGRPDGAASTVTPVEPSKLALPDKPSIAVLPFQNMSGDPEQDYFADGVVEEITTGLSRIKWIFVIARNSSFTYKNRTIDAKQVGRELGVHYLLEGSVRKSESRVRITAQLIDALTGHHIWADRYDRDLTDIFKVQDEITEQVVTAVEPRLFAAEGIRARRKPPESLDAWECVIRALPFVSSRAKADLDAAAEFLQKAIAIDPSYARAYSLLSFITALAGHLGLESRDSSLRRASETANKALFLDPDEPWAYYALGCVLIFKGQAEAGAKECRKALALDPNFALAHTLLGIALAFQGESEAAHLQYDEAERLSPQDLLTRGNSGVNNMARSWACFVAGQYRDGIEFAKRAIAESPSLSPAYRILVVNCALANEIDAAKAALQEMLQVQRGVTPGWIKEWALFARPEDRQKYLEGFRLAGFE